MQMITWAALLLLRGLEDDMTHPDGANRSLLERCLSNDIVNPDFHLIQAHLHSLKRSNQSAASIHNVLTRRLESAMQAMHTTPPMHPTPDSSAALAFPLPNMGDTWTIFDQEIVSLANPPWLFQDSSQPAPSHRPANMELAPSWLQSGMTPVQYDSDLLVTNASSFPANAPCDVPGHMLGAFPSMLNRLFGNEKDDEGGTVT